MGKIRIIYCLEAVGGGALKHLAYLVTRLNKNIFEITVVLSKLRDDNSDLETQKIIASGAEVIFLPIHRNIRLIKDLQILFQIIKILKKGKFDIAHAHSSKAGGLLRLAACLSRVKSILYTPHCFYFQGKTGIQRIFYVSIEKILARITSRIIVSEGEKIELLSNRIINPNYVLNINNAIDFNEYYHLCELNEVLAELSIPKAKFIVGAVGRLSPQKDWETFIFAANKVLLKHPQTIFIIAGEGEQKNDIEKLVFSLGLEKSIFLLGYIHDIYKVFGIIDVYVNTSLWEGLPYVLLEAMSYKKPVITTDTGNSGLIQHEKNGFVIPVKDYITIAEKISELIEDKQKIIQMGIEGDVIITKKYSFELFIEKHEELYIKLQKNKVL